MPLRPEHAASFQGQSMQLEVNMQVRVFACACSGLERQGCVS